MKHAYENGLATGAPIKKIFQLSKDGVVLNEFNSVLEASNFIGINGGSSNIVKCAKGIIATAYGYIWKY